MTTKTDEPDEPRGRRRAAEQDQQQAQPHQADPGPQSADSEDAGQDEVQRRMDEANEKGYFGETPDDTPNENYTLQGVGSGAETPETRPPDQQQSETQQ